jgi:hypothetical protein
MKKVSFFLAEVVLRFFCIGFVGFSSRDDNEEYSARTQTKQCTRIE